MKLAKLSLAAVIAAGAFSVANATSLEDAIKGVDLSGMVRLRFYNNDHDKSAATSDQNRWRGSSIFKFTIPVSDTFKFHYDVLAEQNAISNGNTLSTIKGSGGSFSSDTKGTNSLVNAHIFMSYSNAGLNVIAGRIPVVTSVTPGGYLEPLGSGIVATYGLGNGFTVAGAFVDDIENVNLGATGADIVGGAILYGSDMVSAQVWGYRITNVLKNDVTVSVKVKPMAGVTVAGDYATSKLDAVGADNHTFWNVSAAYAANGFSGKVGYADTNKHAGAIVLNADAALGNVTGQQDYNVANYTDTSTWYARLGYAIDAKTKIAAEYHSSNDKTAADDDRDEYVFYGYYTYNKKLSFRAYYSVLDHDNSNANDNNQLQLQAVYKF